MTATILDGRTLALELREELRAEVRNFAAATGAAPALAVVLVAGDPSAARYVRTINKTCDNLGIAFVEQRLPPDATQHALESVLRTLSADEQIDGVLVQLPLPGGLSALSAITQIDPRKDVDGVHPYNTGLLAQGQPAMVPNTPAGGIELLHRYDIPLAGKRAIVVGRSIVVGRPMALLLLQADATVTIAHSRTPDLAAAVSEAEIVVVAVGRAGLITGAMLRPGAVVVDFGTNVLPDGSLVGDVDFASASQVAAAITPVPGGTGPVTNMMLMRNVLVAAHAVRG